MDSTASNLAPLALEKCPTGIRGLDDITFGGLPAGRPTLLCGGRVVVRPCWPWNFWSVVQPPYNQPGVFISFEESIQELVQKCRVSRLGPEDPAGYKPVCPRLYSHRAQPISGNGDLRSGSESLPESATPLIELGPSALYWTLSKLCSATYPTVPWCGQKLRRLFLWLKKKGVTAIITAESGGAHSHPPWHGRIRF